MTETGKRSGQNARPGRNSVKNRNKQNIIPYRRRMPLHFSAVLLIAIIVYILFIGIRFLLQDQIKTYEVTTAVSRDQTVYTGIVLRNETLSLAPSTGYVNYYVANGSRVSVGTTVCTLDETGSFNALLSSVSASITSLSEDTLSSLQSRLHKMVIQYSPSDFSAVYSNKQILQSEILTYVNQAALESLAGEVDLSNFLQIDADRSGLILFSYDGYESLTDDQIQADPSAYLPVNGDTAYLKNYSLQELQKGIMYEEDAIIYRTIYNNTWSLIFPLNEEDTVTYWDSTTMDILMGEDEISLSGTFSRIKIGDQSYLGKITFSTNMEQVMEDRYVSFRIGKESILGLKIPKSAVTTKDFYLIPKAYGVKGGDENKLGFMVEVYTDGGITTQFTATDIFASDDDYYYVSTDAFSIGTYLIMPDSADRYMVGKTASLEGVYNINKGYTVFCRVIILSETSDGFYVVERNTSNGITIHDYIALNGAQLEEGELLYR